MASSNTTLAGLWVDDASSSSPVKHTITVSTPTRMSSAGNTIDIKDDMLQFYKDSGLEPMAKEVGILDSQGELQGYAAVSGPKGVQMIAVPIQQSPAKSPAIKVEQIQVQRQVVQTPPHRVVTPATGLYMRTPTNQQQHQQHQAQSPWQQHTTPASMVSAGMSGGRKRTVDIMEGDYTGSAVKSGGSRGHKGLRHFSTKVCEKVEKKGTTTYGEVADELVRELNDPFFSQVGEYDQKNIRRRVYDALNVLMAMNIISKEKKEIKWIGLPTNSAQEVHNLETEKKRRQERIRHKTSQLQELILQQIAFKNLVNRNRENERLAGKKPSSNSSIQLPYIIVNTSKRTVIDCSISNDKYEYLFNFDNTFEIHDDIEVLKRMGMAFGLEKNQCSQEDVKKALRMVPKALEPYVLELANPSGTSGTRIGLGASLSAASSSSASSMDLDTDTRGSGGGALSRQSSMLRGGDDLDEDMDDDVDVYSDSGADDSERSSPTPSHARLH